MVFLFLYRKKIEVEKVLYQSPEKRKSFVCSPNANQINLIQLDDLEFL